MSQAASDAYPISRKLLQNPALPLNHSCVGYSFKQKPSTVHYALQKGTLRSMNLWVQCL